MVLSFEAAARSYRPIVNYCEAVAEEVSCLLAAAGDWRLCLRA